MSPLSVSVHRAKRPAIRRAALGAAIVLILSAIPAGAQTATPSAKLTVRVFGGLLGQVEGFCEDPGGPYDWNQPAGVAADANEQAIEKGRARLGSALVACGEANGTRGSRWLGGSFGVARAINHLDPGRDDLLLVAGNNRGTGFGSGVWDHLAALRPHAVALGPEDFVRTMTGPAPSARDVRDWVREAARIPLLASNVAIRRESPDLNSLEDGRFTLHLDDDQSVSWIASAKLDGPRLSAPSGRLEEFAQLLKPTLEQRASARDIEVKAGKEGEDSTITFAPALRPDRWYRLTVMDGGERVAAFLFQTDAALTPMPAARPELAGYPVRATTGGDWLIVALVDPETTAREAASAWHWDEADGRREMVFLDPGKTLAAIAGLLKEPASEAGKDEAPPPGIILLSSLTDEDTMALMAEFPQIRILVLPPRSALIGRASSSGEWVLRSGTGAPDKTRFSGDLGFAAVIDRQYPEATKVVVRPEWFGETLLTVTADVGTSPFHRLDRTLQAPDVAVDVVPGAAWTSSVMGTSVAYSAVIDGETIPIGNAPLYRDCPVSSGGACADFRSIWEEGQLPGVIGDALRREAGTDLAMFAKDLIDADYQAYVRRALKNTSSSWISRYVLERVIYASPRIVKGRIAGADLAATLGKALKADDTLCISGIGAGCPSTVDLEHAERLTINGRRLNARLFYSIALPDYLAESLGLSHDDDEGVDVVAAVDRHLTGGWWVLQQGTATEPLTARLEERRSRQLQAYFAASTLDAGLTYIRPRDPENGTGVRKNLGLPFSGAEETRTISFAVDSDLGVIDARSFALRVPTSLQYARRKEPNKISFDNDEFATGLRFDWKYRMARPFIGVFIDGQLRDHPASLKASRKLADDSREGFQASETATFSTLYTVEPRRYRHVGVGLDLVELKSFPIAPMVSVTVRKLGGRWTRGSESNVPTGLTIGGVEQPLDRLLSEGESALLNEYFSANPDTFSRDVQFDILTARLGQTRIQADADGEVIWKVKNREYSGDVKVRYRWYDSVGAARSDFQLASDFRVELKLGLPLVWRFKLVPSYVYQAATIEADTDDVFRYSKIDVKISLPLVVRFGQGRLVR